MDLHGGVHLRTSCTVVYRVGFRCKRRAMTRGRDSAYPFSEKGAGESRIFNRGKIGPDWILVEDRPNGPRDFRRKERGATGEIRPVSCRLSTRTENRNGRKMGRPTSDALTPPFRKQLQGRRLGLPNLSGLLRPRTTETAGSRVANLIISCNGRFFNGRYPKDVALNQRCLTTTEKQGGLHDRHSCRTPCPKTV